MMNSEGRSSNSATTNTVSLYDGLQTGPNSYISSSTDPETRCSHDSDTMSRKQELRCTLAEENTNPNESPKHRYKIQPSKQCLTDSVISPASSTTNMTNHEGLLEDKYSQIYKPCDCSESQTYLGKMHNIVASPQSCSWDEMEQDTYISTLQDTSYNQDEAPCSFKIIVMPPKKHDRSTYICKECGQHFTKESNLKKHTERLSQQLAEPYFKCKYCSHVFKSKEARKRHHPVHKVCPTIGFTKVRCSVCGFMFSSREKLQHHLHRFTENPDERIFKCFFLQSCLYYRLQP
ncbi:zinc finger protein 391-like [Scylla paramamosain]|uniref:zinc finger protein 391-like n=1 Tax=Scylla paramamosain TaxID=85552 RepID=UPI003083ADA6